MVTGFLWKNRPTSPVIGVRFTHEILRFAGKKKKWVQMGKRNK